MAYVSYSCVFSAIAVAASSSAATIGGVISDGTGAALPSTRVTLKAVATGEETVVETDASGRYNFNVSGAGSYLVIVTRSGFSEAARTVVIERHRSHRRPAGLARAWRMSGRSASRPAAPSAKCARFRCTSRPSRAPAIEQANPLSTGDALAGVVEHRCRSATGRSASARGCAASIRRACWCWSTASV